MKKSVLLIATFLMAGNAFSASHCTGELKLSNYSFFSRKIVRETVREVMKEKGVELVKRHNPETSVVTVDIMLLKVINDKGANFYIKQKGQSMEYRGWVDNKEDLKEVIRSRVETLVPECN